MSNPSDSENEPPILPCPFCGDKDIHLEESVEIEGFAAECITCWATGPVKKTRALAIKAWNNRE